jgi:hypothetical protein
MAYDEKLAGRVRSVLKGRRGVSEKKMFGGLCFLVRGNMACGIVDDELMVRVGPDAYEDALARTHCHEMDFTGRGLRPLPSRQTRREIARESPCGIAFSGYFEDPDGFLWEVAYNPHFTIE